MVPALFGDDVLFGDEVLFGDPGGERPGEFETNPLLT